MVYKILSITYCGGKFPYSMVYNYTLLDVLELFLLILWNVEQEVIFLSFISIDNKIFPLFENKNEYVIVRRISSMQSTENGLA